MSGWIMLTLAFMAAQQPLAILLDSVTDTVF